MAEATLRGLRRWLQPATVEEAPADDAPLDNAHPSREVEFWAYSEDCRIFGFLQLDSERLSDHLNSARDFELSSVLLVALEDNRSVEMRRLVVHPDELVAVRAAAPRGNAARRKRTRPAPVAMRAGPYMIHGYVHTPPGSDPVQQFRRRKHMVPLTEAWIEYQSQNIPHRARVGTVVVNRDFVDWIDHARDADVRVDLPIEMRIDPRAKDLTGQVRVFRDEDADAHGSPSYGAG